VSVYVVIIENDREIYPSRAYARRSDAEDQLRIVREEWAERYGNDDMEADDDTGEVSVLDGPWARLFELEVLQDAEGDGA
jgi:hypothetical protein